MEAVGLDLLFDVAQRLIQRGRGLRRLHHQRHGVDAGGDILHVDAVAFQYLQRAAYRPLLGGHTVLRQGDDGEALFPGDAGDHAAGGTLRLRLVEALPDHGAGVVGLVGVADIQGDVLLPHRRDGALVEHLRADVAQLPQLGVGDALDGAGIGDDLGVRHQEAGHVRPVLVHVGVQRGRRQRAGDVAAAAGEGVDGAVGQHAVEAGDHHTPPGGAAQRLIACLLVHSAVHAEAEPQAAVQKVEAQIVRHNAGGEVFAPAHQLVSGNALVHPPAQGVEFLLQRRGQPQLIPYLQVAAANHVKDPVAADAVLQMCVAQVQQVGDLVILLKTLAGGTDHHHAAAGVALHDGAHLLQLVGVRHGGAAEFQHFQHRKLLFCCAYWAQGFSHGTKK